MNVTSSLKTLQALIGGMDCGGCARTIEARLKQLSGVTEAEVNFATGRLSVSYDSKLLNKTAIAERVTALGYTVDMAQPSQLKTLQALVGGMDCPSCAKTIQANLMQIPGITDASINFASGKLTVSYNPGQVEEKLIKARIQELGYTVEPVEESTPVTGASPGKEKTQKQDFIGWRFWISSRQGQRIILSGLGLLLGVISQQLELSVWIARAFW